tara:strand:- start:253 stop:984 length:732 start_codon:yes stop_codon:yes gene_type:complete
MAQSTLMFNEQIEDVFGDLINDGRIQCSPEQFKEKLGELQKQIKLLKRGSSKKNSRKTSNFMNWLSSEKRSEIKDEYFGDFDEYSDWSTEGIRNYYTKKSLPLEKLNKLIEKKEEEGKEMKKPRLMSLITIKAGLIWSEMDDSEKNEFKTTDDGNHGETPKNSHPKKGRPAGYKATQFASEQAIMTSLKNAQDVENDEEGDSVELEMFVYEGREIFKDDNGNVYNEDYEDIGKITSDGNVVFA